VQLPYCIHRLNVFLAYTLHSIAQECIFCVCIHNIALKNVYACAVGLITHSPIISIGYIIMCAITNKFNKEIGPKGRLYKCCKYICLVWIINVE